VYISVTKRPKNRFCIRAANTTRERERERERERKRKRERKKEREKKRECVGACVHMYFCVMMISTMISIIS